METKEPKEYVIGFLFDLHGEQVALIRKNKPDWQRGKLNGVGGHVEPLELPYEAMRREFVEEAGADLPGWVQFAKVSTKDGATLHCFSAHSQKIYELQSMTDEHVDVYLVDNLLGSESIHEMIPNVRWLIPMALSFEKGEGCDYFEVQER